MSVGIYRGRKKEKGRESRRRRNMFESHFLFPKKRKSWQKVLEMRQATVVF